MTLHRFVRWLGRGPVATLIFAVPAVLVIAALTTSAEGSSTAKEVRSMLQESYSEMFAKSQAEKKGLTLFVQGRPVVGLVTAIHDDVVELRSQEFSRIVVRIDRIDGMAIY